MRIHILSDLHLEFAPFTVPNVVADVVVLAGDVHTGKNGFRWISENFPNKPVIYVLGNHEFYGQKIPKLTEELKEQAKGTNIHVVENDRVEIDGVVFLGATLWTDFELDGNRVLAEVAARTSMTDFRRIRVFPTYSRFRPADARRFHVKSLAWIRNEIKNAAGKKVVVVTHHAPSPRSIGQWHKNDQLNAAYASNLEPFISEISSDLWIHGHIHRSNDYLVGKTRIVSNPRGYPDENLQDFNPELVIHL